MFLNRREKLERNIDIYIARKKGATYRKLMADYNISYARVQQLVDIMEKRLSNSPELAILLSNKLGKKLIEKEGI